jgi:hypothetical protein
MPPINESNTLSVSTARIRRQRVARERQSKRRLMLPCRAARQQQVSQVRACDQQYQQRARRQKIKTVLQIAAERRDSGAACRQLDMLIRDLLLAVICAALRTQPVLQVGGEL